MRRFFILLILLSFGLTNFAEKNPDPRSNRKSTQAVKISRSPEIGEMADDTIWQTIPAIDDFRQYLPVYDARPAFRTEIKIAYDDYAIYILARMYDPHPDSILRQLGLRDEEYLNADMLSIKLDTYNNQMDAYSFTISASGVQLDSRESDETYDAVWDSDAEITRDGWMAELKIPYSALRFASEKSQVWGMQISRSVRRYREIDQWAIELPEAKNKLPYWGTLLGIENIEPPVRLSATPYVLIQAEHYPNPLSTKDISTSVGGGMDLKYGINESFTLDMSLLPDFSQVQSDNKIKNLTAFETVYEEQRPFFREAVDLFMKGDIFYSRRIGKTPALFYSAQDQLNEAEHLNKNPVQQRLLNATKISGRTKKGLAIGVLNAVTANTYAIAEDTSRNTRRILTDPLTNYNLLVFDQALKNNSDLYITNSNVTRNGSYRDANVTASGLSLNDKSNTYRLNLSGGVSQVFTPGTESETRSARNYGFKYGISAQKTNGNLLWSLNRSAMNTNFDANDLGLTVYNNYNSNIASVSYNIYKPFWMLRDMLNTLTVSNQNNFTTHKPETAKVKYNAFMNTMNYLSVWVETGHKFAETYDYYEPRTPGMYYMLPRETWGRIGVSSDYRKLLAFDGALSGYTSLRDHSKGLYAELSPILRINNHVTFRLSSNYEKNINEYGFVAHAQEKAIFGKRETNTIVNSISSKYLFENNLSLSFVARHYFSQGRYAGFYTLQENGYLVANTNYTQNHDFSFNTFNIDMVLSWIFAPGSSMNIVWKNEITKEKESAAGSYFNNLDNTLHEPQLNNISVKVLYYIDYQRLRNKER